MPNRQDGIQAESLATGTAPPTGGGEDGTGQDLAAHDLGTAGRFRLRGEIARGGMGVVYSALDPQFGREIAVKTLHERRDGRADVVRRFEEESRITGQLQHPGIPAVFESGQLDDGRPYIAMKLVKGRTLAELLEGGRLNRTDLIPEFEQICQAVAYAHSRRVLHRDLKPSNVMVGAFGEVQVMDWGLAKVLGEIRDAAPTDPETTTAGVTAIHDPRSDSGGSETQAGSMLGTPAYMPPEQAAGAIDLIDERADVFGLGAILCVILTGEPPYAGKDGEAVRVMAVRAKLEGCYARLDASGADPALVALARRCLSPEVADRPRNAGEVAAAVAELRRRADERARQAELERARSELRIVEERKRRRVQIALAASVLGFALLTGGGAWWAHHQATERSLMEQAHEEREKLTEQVREEREKRIREGVERVFARLPELYDRALWTQAEASLEQAMHILGEDGDAELRGRVVAAQRDTAFVRRLDEIRLGKIALIGGKIRFAAALPKYGVAFRERGYDPDAADRAGLLRRLNDSPVRAYLLTALDDWALTETDAGARKRLFALTAEATGQHWRTRLAEVWTDGERLAKAYDAIPPGERSAGLIAGVGGQLQKLGQEGVRRLEEGLRRFPSDFWLHAWLGISGGKERQEGKIGACRAALAIRPGAAAIHYNLGVLLAEGGDPVGASACYREAIRLDPKDAKAFHNLGNVLKAGGDPVGASACYREAIRLDPKDAGAFNNLGVLLAEGGDPVGASACYREAIRLDPKDAKAFSNLGRLLADGGDRAGSSACYREAIRLDPKLAGAFNNMGNLLKAGGDPVGASACYREAIRLDPKHAGAFNNMGVLLADGGDCAGSSACYREAIRLDPKFAQAFRNLGALLAGGGDPVGASACYREAIRLDPKFAQAFRNLGALLAGGGDPVGASACYREAIRLDPKHAGAFNNMGNILKAGGDPVGASACFREAIRLDPKNAYAHANLGLIAMQQGRMREAVEALDKAHALMPDHKEIQARRAMTKRLLALSERLPAIERGSDAPASPAEAVQFAEFALREFQKRYAPAYRLYLVAFAGDANLVAANRYNAACTALRFAAGDDPTEKPPGKQRASLRKQAAEWLAADLSPLRGLAASAKAADRKQAATTLGHWLRDADLASVRDPKQLAALPPEERERWEAFWADVRAELAKAWAKEKGKP